MFLTRSIPVRTTDELARTVPDALREAALAHAAKQRARADRAHGSVISAHTAATTTTSDTTYQGQGPR